MSAPVSVFVLKALIMLVGIETQTSVEGAIETLLSCFAVQSVQSCIGGVRVCVRVRVCVCVPY